MWQCDWLSWGWWWKQLQRKLLPSRVFRCKHSLECLHPLEICNGEANCKAYQEDEEICEMFDYKCPTDCVCTMILLYCNKAESDELTAELIEEKYLYKIKDANAPAKPYKI